VAIALFSVVALRQQRLKLLIAYSTLAQIGYLFLMFPLAFDVTAGQLVRGDALTAGMLQAISHATAKAAMFMAAGSIYAALGHDRITGMAGVARALPIAMLALALGGVALMGVLPSGAYLAKKLLMSAADGSGQWWWAWVLLAGGALTSSYVVLVIARAFQRPAQPVQLARQVSRVAQSAALALAVCSLLLACATLGPLPSTLIANPLAPKELAALLVTVGCGGALAWALCVRAGGATDVNPVERLAMVLGGAFERSDSVLRRWPVAGIALLAVAGGFGLALRG
jgi:NADH:ubiquinone oxidoreductase subunit 5 (subunit L)/multisubunit Na+/H+ antiporter MnhA subunit